jgi:hypothetical protein
MQHLTSYGARRLADLVVYPGVMVLSLATTDLDDRRTSKTGFQV